MNHQYSLHQGVYRVQSGFKGSTALIDCPYISHKIEVYDVSNLKILDGAQVYWIEIRKFSVSKRNTNKQQTIIQAAIVGLKNCKYICNGINILCTICEPSEDEQDQSTNFLRAQPINKRLPSINILKNQFSYFSESEWKNNHQNLPQFYYWVRILYWNPVETYPTGSISGIFSKTKTAQAEAQAILNNLEINQKQLHLSSQQKQFSTKNLPVKHHQQFLQPVFTIDPKQCDDMQDALSVKIINKNLYEIGVHIADVSSYMDLVDRDEICKRACTLYLPHRKISLFPEELTQICSFQAKERRLAFSVFMQMNEKGEIVNTNFKKTIITNSAKLSYKQAQQIIETSLKDFDLNKFGQKHILDLQEASKIVENVKILKRLAAVRRKIRKQQEILDRNQVFFELNQEKMPIQIGIKKRFQSQKLVQEFMIAANGEVARKLITSYGQNALIIHHPRPSQYSINNFNSFLSDFGIKFDGESILRLQTQMKKLFEKQGFKDQFKEALMMRAIQMQEIATYTLHLNSQKGHYGLNMDYYTHFTSPLRRFADVLVHQQLNACLQVGEQTNRSLSIHRNLYQSLQHLNKARRKNKKLKQNIVQGFLNLFLYEKKETIEAKALIMSLGLKSATLYIPLYNIVKQVSWSKPVQYSGKDAIKVKYNEIQHKQCWKTIHKNDSIDIRIQSDIHQEVKVCMLTRDSQSSQQNNFFTI